MIKITIMDIYGPTPATADWWHKRTLEIDAIKANVMKKSHYYPIRDMNTVVNPLMKDGPIQIIKGSSDHLWI